MPMTLGAAYASRAEQREGSLEVGKRAEGDSTDIASGHVALTIVDGRIVYEGPPGGEAH